MNINVHELVTTKGTDFIQKFGKLDNLSENDCLKLLVHSPQDMIYFVK